MACTVGIDITVPAQERSGSRDHDDTYGSGEALMSSLAQSAVVLYLPQQPPVHEHEPWPQLHE